jgi:hypothetical protein
MQRVGQLPHVDGVVGGFFVPWRDTGRLGRPVQFMVEGYTPADGEENPYARERAVGPGFFATLGIPVVAGREFTEADRIGNDRVVIVSQSVAQRLFPNGDALNRKLWTTNRLSFSGRVNSDHSRIVGVVADVDDEHLVPEPTMTVYHPIEQEMSGGRLFIHAKMDPYALVPPVTKVIRELASDQPVERAATLDDIRAEVLAPTRVNALVFGGFAGVALLIAIVGVAGVLAFSVSARTREFGVRLAIGSTPTHLLVRVLREGAAIGVGGIVAGAIGGMLLSRVVGSFVPDVQMPGLAPIAGAALVLVVAAIVASLTPAARASRVDVVCALRAD